MQSVPYLKKKMYELLKEMLPYQPDLMKYATYTFYRGSERLEGNASDGEGYVLYKMYHRGYFISLTTVRFINEKSEYGEIDHIIYHLQNKKWVKSYQCPKVF